MAQTEQNSNKNDGRQRSSRAYGVAIELAGSIIGMTLLGWLLDRWVGTSPMWTLVGAGIGAVGGFYNFMRKAMALNREEAAAFRREHPKGVSKRVGGPTDPGMFARGEVEVGDEDVPDFKLPPDLQSEVERKAAKWNRLKDDDAKS